LVAYLEVDGLEEVLAVRDVEELDFAGQGATHGQELSVWTERYGVDPLNLSESRNSEKGPSILA
jgi:hypothetical protein